MHPELQLKLLAVCLRSVMTKRVKPTRAKQGCLCVCPSLTVLEHKLPVGRLPELTCPVLFTLTTEPWVQ